MPMTELERQVRNNHKVRTVGDERSGGGEIMVVLNRGFAFDHAGVENVSTHAKDFPNWRGALGGVQRAMPCSCSKCRK